MKDFLNELGGHLISFVSFYLVYYFSHILWIKGRHWVLAKYLIAGILMFLAIGIQREWAGLARTFSEEGIEFHVWMDQTRGYVNFLVAIPFLIGAYIYEAETREIKNYKKMTLIYFLIISVSVLVSWI